MVSWDFEPRLLWLATCVPRETLDAVPAMSMYMSQISRWPGKAVGISRIPISNEGDWFFLLILQYWVFC